MVKIQTQDIDRYELLYNSLRKYGTDDLLIYMDSHLVRANIARIVGLVSILRLSKREEYDEVIERLEVQVLELEALIGELKGALPRILKS